MKPTMRFYGVLAVIGLAMIVFACTGGSNRVLPWLPVGAALWTVGLTKLMRHRRQVRP